MSVLAAIEPDQIESGLVVVLVLLALLAFAALRFTQKIVTKVVLLIMLVAAGGVIYNERGALDDCQERVRSGLLGTGDKPCSCSFAGFDITVPQCNGAVREPQSF